MGGLIRFAHPVWQVSVRAGTINLDKESDECGEHDVQARTPPEEVADTTTSNIQKRALELWEPEYFSKLVRRRCDFKFEKHVEDEPGDMRKIVDMVTQNTHTQTGAWIPLPTETCCLLHCQNLTKRT